LRAICTGWPQFEDYLLGRSDGVPKTAGVGGGDQRHRGGRDRAAGAAPAGKRVLVVVSHSLQRSEHGEQPVWMAAVLAAMLGQLGLPGGGYNYALGAIANYGRTFNAVPVAAFPQGVNPVKAFIPVARISDMLLNPRAVRLRRPAPDLSGHPAGLLGRRQPVPSPSGPQPAAAGGRQHRDVRGA